MLKSLLMENQQVVFHKKESFTSMDGGVLEARKALNRLKEVNKPFLDKHEEYYEENEITIGEIDTTLEYWIKKK